MSDYTYTGAFKALGYNLVSVRQDWSAENQHGICLSLWSGEMRAKNGLRYTDTKIHCGPIEIWRVKSGGEKRHIHLERAWNKLDRWVDVVIRTGDSDEDGAPSNPWFVEKRKNYKWRLQTFESDTGHFSITIEPFPI